VLAPHRGDVVSALHFSKKNDARLVNESNTSQGLLLVFDKRKRP